MHSATWLVIVIFLQPTLTHIWYILDLVCGGHPVRLLVPVTGVAGLLLSGRAATTVSVIAFTLVSSKAIHCHWCSSAEEGLVYAGHRCFYCCVINPTLTRVKTPKSCLHQTFCCCYHCATTPVVNCGYEVCKSNSEIFLSHSQVAKLQIMGLFLK